MLIETLKIRFKNLCPNLFDFLSRLKNGPADLKCNWPAERLIAEDMDVYEKGHGHRFDFNHPVTFTEKLLWYKRNFSGDGRLDRVVDKIEFKSYIEERLGAGHTIPLIGYWSDIKGLKRGWASLPNAFCLKSSISYGGNNILVVKDKSTADLNQILRTIREWFKPENTSLNSFGSAYYSTTPRVLAEEYMSNVENQLYDYKFFCFKGELFCVYVAMDHFGRDGSHISFYDMDWNQLDVQYGDHIVEKAQCPKHFSQMKKYASILSKDFPFVRVDFFDTEDELYLAEMTLYPGGGHTPYHPESFDLEMGKHFILPTDRNE